MYVHLCPQRFGVLLLSVDPFPLLLGHQRHLLEEVTCGQGKFPLLRWRHPRLQRVELFLHRSVWTYRRPRADRYEGPRLHLLVLAKQGGGPGELPLSFFR